MKLFNSIIISLFLILTSLSSCFADNVIFSDDFNDGNSIGWVEVNNDCGSSWDVIGFKYGIVINKGCTTNVKPSFTLGGYLNRYKYEVDMTISSDPNEDEVNMDRAFLFLVKDRFNWYDLHIFGQTITFEKLIGDQVVKYFNLPNYAFQEGQTYRLSVEANNHKLIFKINNIDLYEYYDTPPYLDDGTIGLRAGAGSVTHSEVWFDNVVVTGIDAATPTPTASPTPVVTPTPTATPVITPTPTIVPTIVPTPTPKIPVVIVPGLGGSWNYKKFLLGIDDPDGWILTPTVKVYKNLIKTLEDAGFVKNSDLFVFLYDWRRPLEETAGVLNNYLTNKFGSQKVNLVGHSLGGMLLNTYVQTITNPLANKVITLSSPHQGAVEAYPSVSGGDLTRSNFDETFMSQILLKRFQLPFETNRDTILRVVPSSAELLPVFNYLRKNGTLIPYSSMSLKNPLLDNLKNTQNTIPSKTIFSTYSGDKLSTMRYLDVVEPTWYEKSLGLWKDGKVVNKENLPLGDGYVLKDSGIINALGIKNEVFDNYDHTLIVSGEKSIKKVLEEFGISGNPVVSNIPKTNLLIFMLASPAKLNVIDPLLRDLDSIPDIYVSFDKKFVIIPNPISGVYKTDVIGTGDGEFRFYFGRAIDDSLNWFEAQGNSSSTSHNEYNFSVNSEQIIEEPLIDNDGQDYRGLIIAKLKNIKAELSQLRLLNKIILSENINKITLFVENNNNSKCNLVNGIESRILNLRITNALLNLTSKKEFDLILEKNTSEILDYLVGMSGICNKPGDTSDKRFTTISKSLKAADAILSKAKLGDKVQIVSIIFQRSVEKFNEAQNEKKLGNLLKSSLLLDFTEAFIKEVLTFATLK